MNITRLNFAQSLPFIKNIIKKSHYVSIDIEMSGIVSDIDSQPSLVDSVHIPSIRFNKDTPNPENESKILYPFKLASVSTKLMPPKICIILFMFHRVKFYPFNFYVYPLSIY
jgi:hypothetical protein